MSTGDIILAAIGFVLTLLGIVAVFRRGTTDSIDRKRESELTRLDNRITEVETELQVVRKDSRLVAAVAVRAIRHIEQVGGPFPVSEEEEEALERTRPLIQ